MSENPEPKVRLTKNHLRSLEKIADDYQRLAFPEDEPIVRRTRKKILKDIRGLIELARRAKEPQ